MTTLTTLELGLVIGISILALVLIVLIMYYFLIYKNRKATYMGGSAEDIINSFQNLQNFDDQMSVASSIENYLVEKRKEMKSQISKLGPLLDDTSNKPTSEEVEAEEESNYLYGNQLLTSSEMR